MYNILKYSLAFFFIFAGFYHFVNPPFYKELIPDYLAYKDLINYLSGILEVVLGVLVLHIRTRKFAGYLLLILLVAFIPSHIYFIQSGSCITNSLCVPEWASYGRLLVVHPILMIWVAKVCVTPQKKHNIVDTNS